MIDGSSIVTLEPGIYVIKDGEFRVGSTAELNGENVGFYLAGETTFFEFGQNTTISLTAPKDGVMAGILFFEQREKATNGVHKIRSNNARLLLGTIYLSKDLLIDANAPVADLSAYTVLIVRSLKLFSGPNLVLNTDYGATDIPVPAGIKGIGNKVSLIK